MSGVLSVNRMRVVEKQINMLSLICNKYKI